MDSYFGTDIAVRNGDLVVGPAGDLSTVDEEATVLQAMQRILAVPLGSWVLYPELGNPLFDMLSAPLDEDWAIEAAAAVRNALAAEPRATIIDVQVELDKEAMQAIITISFDLGDNSPRNLVWPFNLGVLS